MRPAPVSFPPLVSCDWLADRLADPRVRVVDASWWLPTQPRNAVEEYLEDHVPGAVFFDLEDVSDHRSPLPHMLPAAQEFADKVAQLGIGNDDHVIAYDNAGGASAAARVWWMFRVFGHERVSVLDGGFPKWLREQRPTDSGPVAAQPASFTPRFQPLFLRTLDQVEADVRTGAEVIVDARAHARFLGVEPEPRVVPRLGHIPGSVNIPYADLLATREQTFLPPDTLRSRFQAAGIDLDRPVVTTCGSGVTCCVLALALHLIGKTDVASYDGSWAEWSQHLDLPIEARPAS